jgi:hypothetical protein
MVTTKFVVCTLGFKLYEPTCLDCFLEKGNTPH